MNRDTLPSNEARPEETSKTWSPTKPAFLKKFPREAVRLSKVSLSCRPDGLPPRCDRSSDLCLFGEAIVPRELSGSKERFEPSRDRKRIATATAERGQQLNVRERVFAAFQRLCTHGSVEISTRWERKCENELGNSAGKSYAAGQVASLSPCLKFTFSERFSDSTRPLRTPKTVPSLESVPQRLCAETRKKCVTKVLEFESVECSSAAVPFASVSRGFGFHPDK